MNPRIRSRRRETFVVLLLAVVMGSAIFAALAMASGGLLISVLTATAVVFLAIGVHYLLWGRKMVDGTGAGQAIETQTRSPVP